MTAGRGEPHDARTNPDGAAGPWRRLLMTLPAEDRPHNLLFLLTYLGVKLPKEG